jgi:peptide/nickel transport system permease protein
MNRYLARRVGQAVLVLWAAYTVSFLVLYALPGDAVDARFGGDASDVTPEQLQQLRIEYGLDKALPLQYLSQLGRAVTGDLGTSFDNGRPVTALIAESLPATAAVAGLALLLGVLGGAALALLAAGSSSRWSRLPLNLPPLGVAVPSFLFGLLLLEVFSFRLHWFPAIGNEGIRSVILPAITLAIPTGAVVAQLLAKSLQQSMSEPYADTARAKGAGERRVLLRHALRNGVIPALTVAGVLVGQLLAGTVITETVFSRTGLGRLTATAVSGQDIPVVQGLVIFGALVFVVVNLVVDLIYPLLDRRIVHTAQRSPAPAEVLP